VDRDLIRDPGLRRSLLGDGISNVLSGLVGATPNTTYGENIGVMAITRVFSVGVIGFAAVIAVAISFVGKVAALIRSIPTPVMGGVCLPPRRFPVDPGRPAARYWRLRPRRSP
jgi:uracil permease